MVNHLFQSIDASSTDSEFIVNASYVEIYQERIRDLLDGFNFFFLLYH